MPNVLLGVTGSVAAIKTPDLYRALTASGHAVKIVSTQAALYFFDPTDIQPVERDRRYRNPHTVVLDEDEWPGRASGKLYARGQHIVHIELRRWADLFLVAPLDANTLAKLAVGLADNCLTCVWRAWDRQRPVVLAPAMNTLMWEHPLTIRHFRQLLADVQPQRPPDQSPLDQLLTLINDLCPKLHIVPPQSKRLACDDIGIGAMADLDHIVDAVARFFEPTP